MDTNKFTLVKSDWIWTDSLTEALASLSLRPDFSLSVSLVFTFALVSMVIYCWIYLPHLILVVLPLIILDSPEFEQFFVRFRGCLMVVLLLSVCILISREFILI